PPELPGRSGTSEPLTDEHAVEAGAPNITGLPPNWDSPPGPLAVPRAPPEEPPITSGPPQRSAHGDDGKEPGAQLCLAIPFGASAPAPHACAACHWTSLVAAMVTFPRGTSARARAPRPRIVTCAGILIDANSNTASCGATALGAR